MKTKFVKFCLCIALSLLAVAALAQKVTIKGTIVDTQTKEALIGASIVVKGTNAGTTTNSNGEFSLNESKTNGTIIFSYIGYLRKEMPFTANGSTLDLGKVKLTAENQELEGVVITGSGVVDLAEDRKTPIAVSTISISEIQAKSVGNVEFPDVMKNTPSVYVASQAAGFGDSQMYLRGFDQSNTAFLLNGQPINGMEDGLMYWSDWAGMTDMASVVQVQRGLGSSKLAISSVGGTVNIVTKSTDKSKGGFLRLLSGNGGYAKGTLAYSTGMGKKGWGFSFFLDSWRADKQYADGTRGEGQNYFFSVGKKSGRSTFNFLLLGSPQWHDQNYTKGLTSTYKDGILNSPGYDILGKKGNSNYGFLNGKYLSYRRNYYHKPIANFNWDWAINKNSSLSTVLYASVGVGGGTGTYGNSPGYVDGGYNTSDGRVNWNNIVGYNDSVAGGYLNGYNGVAIRSSVNNHKWYGLVTNYENKVGKHLTTNIGADIRFYKGTHFRELINLLGLRGTKETFGGEATHTVIATFDTNPWSALFNYADKDQRIGYDYDEKINYQGVFGQAEWSNDQFSAFVQGAVSNQSYKGIDRSDFSSEKESDWVNKTGYNIKGGISYNLSAANTVFANIGQYSRQPFRDNIFSNEDDETEYDSSVKNEHIFGLEAGYKLNAGPLKLNINLYYTSWNNRYLSLSGSDYTVTNSSSVYYNHTYTDVYYKFQNISELHKGVEVDLRYRPVEAWLIRGDLSIGDWKYNGSSPVKVVDQNTTTTIDDLSVDLAGTKIGDAPQTSFGVVTSYDIIADKFSVDADWNYYAKLYAEVDASDVADASIAGTTYQPDKINNYGLVDFGATYNFAIGPNKLQLRGNIYNLFNNDYFSQEDSYGYMYGNGSTWNFSLKYIF